MSTANQPFALPTNSAALPAQDVHLVPAAPPPPQTIAPVVADANGQIAQLATQLAGLELRRIDILGDLRSSDAGVRTTAQAQLRELDAQVAQTKAALKDVSAAVARQQQAVVIAPPAPEWFIHSGRNTVVPLVILAMAFVILWPIALGIGRRLSRKGAPSSPAISPDTLSPRLDRMEQAIDAIAIEVERISESQRFIAKVLVERGEAPALVAETSMPERHAARASIAPR
jgi:hypothetical protein